MPRRSCSAGNAAPLAEREGLKMRRAGGLDARIGVMHRERKDAACEKPRQFCRAATYTRGVAPPVGGKRAKVVGSTVTVAKRAAGSASRPTPVIVRGQAGNPLLGARPRGRETRAAVSALKPRTARDATTRVSARSAVRASPAPPTAKRPLSGQAARPPRPSSSHIGTGATRRAHSQAPAPLRRPRTCTPATGRRSTGQSSAGVKGALRGRTPGKEKPRGASPRPPVSRPPTPPLPRKGKARRPSPSTVSSAGLTPSTAMSTSPTAMAGPVKSKRRRSTRSADRVASIGASMAGLDTLAVIGTGGFGQVCAGRLHGEDVAVKRIDLTVRSMPELCWKEAEALAILSHPHVLRLVSATRTQTTVTVVTELCGRRTLADMYESPGSDATWGELLDAWHGVAVGLCYVHGQNMVHRDVKPDNVFFKNGAAVLGDFGLAARAGEYPVPAGTFGYMAPEVLCARYVGPDVMADPASDVYSFGVLLLGGALWARDPVGEWAHRREMGESDLRLLGLRLGARRAQVQLPCDADAPCPLRVLIAACLEDDRPDMDAVVLALNDRVAAGARRMRPPPLESLALVADVSLPEP